MTRNRDKTAKNKKSEGGRRKRGHSRKLGKKASDWASFATTVYREMKSKDKSVTFRDALKEASKRRKKGQQ
jgi:hypothetical protein